MSGYPKLNVNGKKVDLSKSLPLRVKHWLELKDRGLDVAKFDSETLGLVEIVALVHYILERANPEVKIEDVHEMSLEELTDIQRYMFREEKPVRPT